MPTITSGGASNQWDDHQGAQEAPQPVVEADDGQGAQQHPEPRDAPTPQGDTPPEPDAQAPAVEEAATVRGEHGPEPTDLPPGAPVAAPQQEEPAQPLASGGVVTPRDQAVRVGEDGAPALTLPPTPPTETPVEE